MAKSFPGLSKRPLWAYEQPFAWVGGGLVVATALSGLIKAYIDQVNGWLWLCLVAVFCCAVFNLVVQIFRARYRDTQVAAKESPQDLKGCLFVLHAMVSVRANSGAKPGMDWRLTVHRVVDSEQLEQCVEYVGGIQAENGPPGRRFSSRSGIIGRCVMSKKPLLGRREAIDAKTFRDEMVEHWHIPVGEVKNLRDDRWAWFAVPILGSDGSVISVVFADAADKDFFTADIQADIIRGSEAILAFVDSRYT